MNGNNPHPPSHTPIKAIVFGCSGKSLTEGEKTFFRYTNPFGFILFQRNCGDPAQVKNLIAELRASVARTDAPVFIDQEGGRVARLKPPQWPAHPPMKIFGDLYERHPALAKEAAFLNGELLGRELSDLGITVNCAPVADVLTDATHQAIGDRAFSKYPHAVSALVKSMAEGLMAGGVLPVMKHMPGHGRATVDSHEHLPRVAAAAADLDASDFLPFRENCDLPIGMSCHLLFEQIDKEKPVSLSRMMVDEVIRKRIGFDGFLMTDDIGMKALSGRRPDLVLDMLRAGHDVITHCSGAMLEMVDIAQTIPAISVQSLARWEKAKAKLRKPRPALAEELYDRLDMLLGAAAASQKKASS